ncbi:histone family protein nucleoid-structuring protein H-NS [Caballeronia calidae]|uniref:Histone family protein nucleoid-structuring protein H-NS n=1 Tax=Caballeronia calidae TaxID=1777139 RepID=A0A158ED22_9BURK|nr:H-NS family nucleoid-associated regulatory protein [Caballeronia calidae]SAL04802.1 histone family protein nucleoid-structuring protein H-NS [Caballeronia calidae]
MATLKDIQSKISKLQAQAEALAKKQTSGVVEKIHELLEKHGLTLSDIEESLRNTSRGRKAGTQNSAKNAPGAAKYRDPKTGATWTGHGRAPAWIANAKDRSKFLVDGDKVVTLSPAKKEPKAGNYVRGPQEPKYRDPQSGATWSGRGKAPAWLASAADRTAFLINASGAASSESTKPAAKKATAKKAATKKATAKNTATKKTAAKKAVVKKAPTQKSAAKKAATKTAATKKTTAKKVAAKKGAAKTAAAKKAPAQTAATATSEAPATTAPVKRAATKKAAAKKGSARKVAVKKVSQAPESAPLVSSPKPEAGESGTSETA